MIKVVTVVGIDWDTDGEDVDLPDELTVKIEVEDPTNDDDVYDAISDALSDATGWCHNGWKSHFDA